MPEIFDSINVIVLVGEELEMVDPHVMKVDHVESIVGPERIGVNNAVRCHFFLDDRQHGFRSCVGYNGSETLATPLEQPECGHFPGCFPASLSFASPSEVTFIRFVPALPLALVS